MIAAGRSKAFLVTLTTASAVNLILDPIFIYGLFGLPAMETVGAAIATVIGQFCGAFAGIILNRVQNREIPLRFTFRVKGRLMGEILRIGIPTTFMQGIVSMKGVFMNRILQGFSSTAVAVYGLSARIQNLATVAVGEFNCAQIPVVAFNYGAHNRARIEESIRWAIVYSLIFTGAAVLLLELFPVPVLQIFDASEEMLGAGVPALRFMAAGYLISVLGLILSTAFQALGLAGYSMMLTILRQVLLPLLLASLFAVRGQLWLVWTAFPIAEAMSIPVGLLLLKRTRQKVIDEFAA